MFNIVFHKDITEVEEKMWLNLTKRQISWCAIGIVIDIFMFYFFQSYLGSSITQWLAIAIAALCGAIGFFRKNGMNFEEYVKLLLNFKVKRSSTRKYKMKFKEDIELEKDYIYLLDKLNQNRKTGK